jgi:iron complex outermembrane receptor protein
LNEKIAGSVSYFDIDQTNMPRNDPNKGYILTVSGEERAKGSEVDLYWYPFEGASCFAEYVYLDSKIVNDVQVPWVVGGIAGDGGACKNSFSGVFTYKVPSGSLKGVGFTVGVISRSQQAPFPSDGSLFALRLPGYTTVNMSVRYLMRDERKFNVELQAGVQNLTNKWYLQGAMAVAEGRTFFGGISCRY